MAEYKITDKETKNALFLSIRRLIRFINKGGKVEPKLLSKTLKNNDELVKSLNSKNTMLLEVEEELKKLGGENGVLKLIDNNLEKDEPSEDE